MEFHERTLLPTAFQISFSVLLLQLLCWGVTALLVVFNPVLPVLLMFCLPFPELKLCVVFCLLQLMVSICFYDQYADVLSQLTMVYLHSHHTSPHRWDRGLYPSHGGKHRSLRLPGDSHRQWRSPHVGCLELDTIKNNNSIAAAMIMIIDTVVTTR